MTATQCLLNSLHPSICPLLVFSLQEEIPESVRQTKERVLQSLKQELSEKLDEKKRRKISKQYRMVRFFGKAYVLVVLCKDVSYWGHIRSRKEEGFQEAKGKTEVI